MPSNKRSTRSRLSRKRHTRKRKQRGGDLILAGTVLVAACAALMALCRLSSGDSSLKKEQLKFLENERRSRPQYYRFVEARILDGTLYPDNSPEAAFGNSLQKTERGSQTHYMISSNGGRTYERTWLSTKNMVDRGFLERNPNYVQTGGDYSTNDKSMNYEELNRLISDSKYADSKSQEEILEAFGLTAEQVEKYLETDTCPV